MANEDLIRIGTATVQAGQNVVTGQSIEWSQVLEGDFFGVHVGLMIPIASVDGSTIKLAYPWPGPTQAAASYAIQPKGDTVRFAETLRQVLVNLSVE